MGHLAPNLAPLIVIRSRGTPTMWEGLGEGENEHVEVDDSPSSRKAPWDGEDLCRRPPLHSKYREE